MNKTTRALMAVVLSAVTIIGTSVATAQPARQPTAAGQCDGTTFTDVTSSNPFCADIAWAVGQGLVVGYKDGTFRPTASVTRQAMAGILYRQDSKQTALPSCSSSPFTDVPVSNPFCGAIAALKQSGVIKGDADGTFRPANPVSRDAAAAYLYRAAGANVAACTTKPFTDVPVSSPFCAEISWLATNKIANGYVNGMFYPGAAVTRQAVAAFLHRAAQVQPPPAGGQTGGTGTGTGTGTGGSGTGDDSKIVLKPTTIEPPIQDITSITDNDDGTRTIVLTPPAGSLAPAQAPAVRFASAGLRSDAVTPAASIKPATACEFFQILASSNSTSPLKTAIVEKPSAKPLGENGLQNKILGANNLGGGSQCEIKGPYAPIDDAYGKLDSDHNSLKVGPRFPGDKGGGDETALPFGCKFSNGTTPSATVDFSSLRAHASIHLNAAHPSKSTFQFGLTVNPTITLSLETSGKLTCTPDKAVKPLFIEIPGTPLVFRFMPEASITIDGAVTGSVTIKPSISIGADAPADPESPDHNSLKVGTATFSGTASATFDASYDQDVSLLLGGALGITGKIGPHLKAKLTTAGLSCATVDLDASLALTANVLFTQWDYTLVSGTLATIPVSNCDSGGGGGGGGGGGPDEPLTWSTPDRLITPIQGTYKAMSCATTSFCVVVTDQGSLLHTNPTAPAKDLPVLESDHDVQAANFTGVSCASTTFCVAVGTETDGNNVDPVASIFDGTSWTTNNPSGMLALTSVSCIQATHVCVAVGTTMLALPPDTKPSVVGASTTLDGTSWGRPINSGTGSDALMSISCVSSRFCMGVSQEDFGAPTFSYGGVAAIFNGQTWIPSSVDDTLQSLVSVSCTSAQHCVAVGETQSTDGGNDSSVGIVYDGAEWSAPALDTLPRDDPGEVSCLSADECVAVTGHQAATIQGGGWKALTGFFYYPGPLISCVYGVACETAAEQPGSVLDVNTYDGTGWGSVLPAIAAASSLTTVSCASATRCAALATAFDGVGSTGLLWNGTSWFKSNLSNLGGSGLRGTSCAANGFCLAYGSAGFGIGWFTSTADSTGWSDKHTDRIDFSPSNASCISASFCMAVGISGSGLTDAPGAYAYDGNDWMDTDFPTTETGGFPTAVSCASSNFCVALGFNRTGQYYVTYNGNTWSKPVTIFTNGTDPYFYPTAVSCGALNYCVIAGTQYDDVDGSRAAILTYDGNAWSAPIAIPGLDSVSSISCAGRGTCVAVDTKSTQPQSTTVTQLIDGTWSAPDRLTAPISTSAVPAEGVSCVSGFCMIVDSDNAYASKPGA